MTLLEASSMVVAGAALIGLIVAAQRHNNHSRNRIYKRMDEKEAKLEKKMKEDFAKKEVCDLKHSQIEKELKEIKTQTTMIPGIAAQLKILVNKST